MLCSQLRFLVWRRDINSSNIGINIRSKEPGCVLFDFDMAMEWPPSGEPNLCIGISIFGDTIFTGTHVTV